MFIGLSILRYKGKVTLGVWEIRRFPMGIGTGGEWRGDTDDLGAIARILLDQNNDNGANLS